MTDLVITPANVKPGSGSIQVTGKAGATITAGQTVYRDPDTLKFLPADSDSATANVRSLFGIALHGASDGQPLTVHKEGEIELGAVLTIGESYYLSDTAGGLMPVGDLESGDYPTFIGIARTTSILKVRPLTAGVAK